MLVEEITALIGDIPAPVEDLFYVLTFIFLIYFVDRLIVLFTSFFKR